MKRNFYSASKVKNNSEIVCTFDTETFGLGGDILCVTYCTPSGSGIFSGENCVRDWLSKVFFEYKSPATHYAHFAQYDWRYILPHLIDMHHSGEIKLDVKMRSETDIFRIEVKKGKHKFVMHDSFALYPQSLDKFAKQFAPDMQKLDIGLGKNVFFNLEDPEHVAYAIRDAESLRACLLNYFRAIKEKFGVDHGQTVAGTAIKAWQYTLDDGLMIDYSTPGKDEDFIRSAYYGGIVFMTDTGIHEDCDTYDVNSSYPSCMLDRPVPFGKPRKTNALQFKNPAIYRVRIKAPDDLQIPIIGARDEKGGLHWYSGEFETITTNIEIQFALHHGYKLLEVYEGLQWHHVIRPFEEFISNCRDIRVNHKDTSYETVAKLMQNSCYGKFGARRERSCIIFGQENIDRSIHTEVTKLQDFDEDVYSAKQYSEDMPCKIEWAVFITAYARLKLLTAAYALGPENVLYGDTDSITVKASGDRSKIDIGSEYGQFKHEKHWTHFRAIAPKTYVGIIDGVTKGKAKGVPAKSLTEAEYQSIMSNGELHVIYDSLPSLLVALKKGISPASQAHRKTSDLKNSIHYYCKGTKCYLKSKHGQNHIDEGIPASASA